METAEGTAITRNTAQLKKQQWVPADHEDHNSFSNKESNNTSLAAAVAVAVMAAVMVAMVVMVDGELQLSVDSAVSVVYQL